MTKRLRLLLILAAIGVAFSFLYPTIRWYLILTPEERQLASITNDQVRIIAQRRAARDVEEIIGLARTDGTAELPEDFRFMIPIVRDRYELEGETVPRDWDVDAVVSSFTTEESFFSELERYHREDILSLKDLRDRTVQLGLDLRGGMYVVIQPDFDSLEEDTGAELTPTERDDALRRALEILNNRIDQFGLTEPQIRRQGENRIIVEVPGEPDPERMRSFILGKGRLNFHIVDQEGLSAFRAYEARNPGNFLDADGNLRDPNVLPAGTRLVGVYEKDAYAVDQLRGYTVIGDDIGLEGTYIRDAEVNRDPVTNQPVVNFYLNGEGGEIFFKLTSDNVGETMAVVLDDRVKSSARIQEAIRDAVRVSGFNQAEADDLALVLRTGALPVPLEIINQQAIGASLGEDAIRQGVNAIGFGLILVVAFMLVYYHGAGVIADLVLALNLFFIVSVLSVFNFTLTLPGIAGLILTVGMAVDANVIIYERIREEYRLGKSAQAAVKSGFDKAFWTVMDANITTFIAAVALSQLGRGPIQGFAVTLSVGIVSSMFTALVVSRLIFEFATDTLRIRKLSIGWRAAR